MYAIVIDGALDVKLKETSEFRPENANGGMYVRESSENTLGISRISTSFVLISAFVNIQSRCKRG